MHNTYNSQSFATRAAATADPSTDSARPTSRPYSHPAPCSGRAICQMPDRALKWHARRPCAAPLPPGAGPRRAPHLPPGAAVQRPRNSRAAGSPGSRTGRRVLGALATAARPHSLAQPSRRSCVRACTCMRPSDATHTSTLAGRVNSGTPRPLLSRVAHALHGWLPSSLLLTELRCTCTARLHRVVQPAAAPPPAHAIGPRTNGRAQLTVTARRAHGRPPRTHPWLRTKVLRRAVVQRRRCAHRLQRPAQRIRTSARPAACLPACTRNTCAHVHSVMVRTQAIVTRVACGWRQRCVQHMCSGTSVDIDANVCMRVRGRACAGLSHHGVHHDHHGGGYHA